MAIQAEAVAVSLNEIVSNTPSKLLVGNVQTPSDVSIELSETTLNIINCSGTTGITDIPTASQRRNKFPWRKEINDNLDNQDNGDNIWTSAISIADHIIILHVVRGHP